MVLLPKFNFWDPVDDNTNVSVAPNSYSIREKHTNRKT